MANATSTRPSSSVGANYRPEIDGLRAVAILAVLLNHIDRSVMPGGYVGVDVFFVISGFLITAIIQRDLTTDRFSFAHFYARRAKRLIPAATVMVASVLLFTAFFFLPKDFQDLGAQTVAYTTMLSNVLFWRWADYFAGQDLSWPLLHTWSLAVEEQFYLVYPLLLWSISGWSTWRQMSLLAGLFVVSLAVSVYQTAELPRSAYYLLPSRAWELLAGAACTQFRIPRLSRRSEIVVGGLAAGMIAGPMLLYSHATPFPGLAAALPVCGTAMMIGLTGGSTSLWRAVLSWPPLVGIGKISYSLYLWHWPVLMVACYPAAIPADTRPRLVMYLAGAVSLVIAWLSYRFVETPTRNAKLSDARALVAAIAASGLVCLTGLAMHHFRGFPGRLPVEVVGYARGALDIQPRRKETIDATLEMVREGRVARLGVRTTSVRPMFALWGDSTADALVPALDAAAERHGLSGYAFTRGGVPPLINAGRFCEATAARLQIADAAIERLIVDRVPNVIMAAYWSLYTRIGPANLIQDGRDFPTDGQRVQQLREEFVRTLASLRAAGAKKIWILHDLPIHPFKVPRQLAWNALRGVPAPQGITRTEWLASSTDMNGMLASLADDTVEVIEPYEKLFIGDQARLHDDSGASLFCDAFHLSVRGAIFLEPAFDRVMAEIAQSTPSEEADVDRSDVTVSDGGRTETGPIP